MDKQMQDTVSTRYLVTMISFFVGAMTLFKGFERSIQLGLSGPLIIKLAICLAIFLPACFAINKYGYFQDKSQHKQLVSLKLSVGQIFISLGVLILLVFVRIVLFGTK
jgi:hypothetical protein